MASDKQMIFDIGMHTGQDTKHYLESGFKVIAVEANPLLVEENKGKFSKAIEKGDLIILNIGISDQRGVLPFYVNKRLSEWSSFNPELGMRDNSPYEVINVECITTQDLFERYGVPFYLKVDIEGYDYVVINGLPPDSKGPTYVSCEGSEISLLDTLHQKGYRKFKLINQANKFRPLNLEEEKKPWHPKYLHIRNTILLQLQKFLSFRHPYSSSGPFAENTKGEWINYEEARRQLSAFLPEKGRKAVNNISWFDIHAALK